jgi:hypothetical protein
MRFLSIISQMMAARAKEQAYRECARQDELYARWCRAESRENRFASIVESNAMLARVFRKRSLNKK